MIQHPDNIQRHHSDQVLEIITEHINLSGGWIGFDAYMQMALYHPGLGYYSAGSVKLGAEGDFITAPLLGDQFAHCLARQCIEVLAQLASPAQGQIIEFGAGTGQMAIDILQYLESKCALPSAYLIIETSADLIERQRQNIKLSAPALLPLVQWVNQLPENFSGVVLANEVLDALPFKRFRVSEANQPRELGVGIESGQLVWRSAEFAPSESLVDRITPLDLPVGYESEIGLQAEAWMASVASLLKSGAIFIIDYGFAESEYYHWDRREGTLMCHFQHTAHSDPFYMPGLQDITAHVNFSAIAAASKSANIDLAGYCSQGSFLISLGILQHSEAVLSRLDTSQDSIELAQQIKKLTLPHEMGELFKVLALTKNISTELSGFKMINNLGRL